MTGRKSRSTTPGHGAEKSFERDDPMQLDAVSVPGNLTVMAEAFVEEYARLGFDEERILTLFRRPFYFATHRYHATYGESATRELVHRVIRRTGIQRYREER